MNDQDRNGLKAKDEAKRWIDTERQLRELRADYADLKKKRKLWAKIEGMFKKLTVPKS